MKKFLLKLSYTILPLWLSAVGLVLFYNVYIVPNMQGDLSRLGKMPTKLFYKYPIDTTMVDTLFYDIAEADSCLKKYMGILVCGDSFSILYKEDCYLNYMATKGLSIYNYAPYKAIQLNPFQSAYDLMHLGYIDSTTVNTLIIESVERHLVRRIKHLNFNSKNLSLYDKSKEDFSSKEHSPLIEAKNFLLLRMSNDPPVKHLKLNTSMFSGSCGDDLYVYHEDVESIMSMKDTIFVTIKKNIERLFAEAESKHIKLIILVCPDKYDLYQDFIIDNPYPAKTINEDLRATVGKTNKVVIGKEILLPNLSKEKDLYLWDDTHWSYKSAKIIADTLFSIIQK
ncbi:MAG: hypothetical protein J1F40_07415 [Prevotellaceae bacterium]|nr:hypothetical protein [Prevotellaceae bacterium]